jgi:hypothetical protein
VTDGGGRYSKNINVIVVAILLFGSALLAAVVRLVRHHSHQGVLGWDAANDGSIVRVRITTTNRPARIVGAVAHTTEPATVPPSRSSAEHGDAALTTG